jgi:prepilin-type N-terminal cleavage/methylation domain-containing protein
MMKSKTVGASSGFEVSTKPGTNLGQMKIKNLRKDQRGFSMMELLLVIALTGIITAAITTAFFQVFNMSRRTANHMVAVTQVQQAGKLVSEDMLEAQAGMIDDKPSGPGEFLKLGWVSQNTSIVHNITYTMENGELWRSESIDGGNATMLRVAEHIDPDPSKTYCGWNGSVLTFTVTATVGEESEQRIYQVKPRSEL